MSDTTPDPVGLEELINHLQLHGQVPEDVKVWEWPPSKDVTKPRTVVCHAHWDGHHCCLDYFFDTIDGLTKHPNP